MLRRDREVTDSPTRLPQDVLPDPLAAIMSGRAGSWHPGHVPYCLWPWAKRPWLHTREWPAAWRFHLHGRQQAEVISPHEPAYPPAKAKLCVVFAIHQLVSGWQSPTINTEEEVPEADAALMSELFDTLCSGLVRHPGSPTMC